MSITGSLTSCRSDQSTHADGQLKPETRAARADLQTYFLNPSEEIYVKQQIGSTIEAGAESSNPLDVVPNEIPFDVPYGLSISLNKQRRLFTPPWKRRGCGTGR